MRKILKNNIKIKKEVSLKTTVLSVFSFVTFILVIVLAFQLYFFSKKLSLESIDLQLNGLAQDIQTSIESSKSFNFNILEMTNELSKDNSFDPFELFIKILKINPSLYSIYKGYENGSFYEIINLSINKKLLETYNTKSTDKWLLIKINAKKPNQKELFFYDSNLNLSSSRIIKNDYNPTLRPWYKLAVKKKTPIKTSPYRFSNIDALGLTYAKEISDSNNVLAIDVLLNDFKSVYQNHIKNDYMNVYLFNDKKEISSSFSNNHSIFKDFFKKDIILDDYKKPKIVSIENEKYIVQIISLNTSTKNDYLILFANFDKINEPFKAQSFNLILNFLFIIILMIPIILYFSNIIVKPIYALVKQSINIKKRKFNNIYKVDSSILEVALLSSSLESMAESIHNYQHSLEEKVAQRTKELSLKNEELLKLSITDKLTGLYNRVKLISSLQFEINRSLRSKNTFSVILADIDFFKKVNDTYGHQVGDDVLKESAFILSNSTRSTDVVGRWGGEEFLIICPETDIDGAKKVALNINNSIKSHIFETYPDTLTMSLGIASFNENILKFEDLVSNADIALYEAKNAGRDRVEVFNQN